MENLKEIYIFIVIEYRDKILRISFAYLDGRNYEPGFLIKIQKG